jgi:hypothetical protein
MKPSQSLRSVALIAVTAAATMILIQACGGNAVAAGDDREPIEGAFDATVTVKNCSTGATTGTLKALLLFHHGGTVTIDNTTPTTLRGLILGTWARGSGDNYTSDVSHFRYNTDGTLAGVNKVRRTIVLSSDATTFTANLRVQVFGNDGTLLSEVCPTETGTRVTF